MAAPTNRSAEEASIQISLMDQAEEDTRLDKYLRRLELFLRCFGFCQYSPLSCALSWIAFVVIGVLVPFLIVGYSNCADCEKYEVRVFELEILIAQVILAAVSLLCVSHNLRKYGLRRLLFVDRYRGHMIQFRGLYIQKIHGFFRILAVWTLSCLILKTAREVARVVYVNSDSWWLAVGIEVALLVLWMYLTVIFLSGTALFNLVCNLQVIHFENYGKLLERDLDVSVYIEEHIRLRHYLSKTSHRF